MYRFFLYFLLCIFTSNYACANIIDNSVNQPSFPPGGLTLVATVNPSSVRRNITVQNQSPSTIQIWRDVDCAGTGLSVILLGPGSGAGKQGAAWSSDSFKNCIRVYALNTDQIAIYQN